MNRILIRVPNWVGDAVMSVPALRELRRAFPSAAITLAGRAGVAGLFEGENLSDEYITLGSGDGLTAKTGGFFQDVRLLRRHCFDLAILLQNAFGAALLAKTAGARVVAGYPTDRRRLLLDLVLSLDSNYKKKHQVHYYLNLAAQIESTYCQESEIDLSSARPTLDASDKCIAAAERLLAESGIDLNRPIVAVNPGATNSRAKQWLPERFAETADLLVKNGGFQCVIVGTPGDRDVAERTRLVMRARPAVLAGLTSLAELKGVLRLSSLLISNDTGAAHVAAALGTPTVVIFGPTEDITTRPLSDHAAIVRHDVECSPCMLRDCPIDHRCMTGVTAHDVYSAAGQLIETRMDTQPWASIKSQ